MRPYPEEKRVESREEATDACKGLWFEELFCMDQLKGRLTLKGPVAYISIPICGIWAPVVWSEPLLVLWLRVFHHEL